MICRGLGQRAARAAFFAISSAALLGACGNSAAGGGHTGAAGTAGSSGGAAVGSLAGTAGDSGAAGMNAGGVGGQAGETSSGAAGAGGSGGAAGAAGGAPGSAGAGGSLATVDGGAAGVIGGGDAGVVRRDFVCTELIGLWVASQWWPSFDKGVDSARWEFMFQHHGYLELFADPASSFWNNAVTPKCTTSAATPDRIVFLPFSLSLNTMQDWVTNLTKLVETMKGKFPSAKRIELMTTLRSPGNIQCANNTDPDSVVAPYVDAAIQIVADASGGLVTVGPKIEVGSCSWWVGNSHDLTSAGNTGAGQLLATYYQTH